MSTEPKAIDGPELSQPPFIHQTPSMMTKSTPTAQPMPSSIHATPSSQMLPDILDRLRLVPEQPLIKLPAADYPNPFQLALRTESSGQLVANASATQTATTNASLRDSLFGPRCCGCSAERKTTRTTILKPKQFKPLRTPSTATGIGSSTVATNATTTVDRSTRRTVLRQSQLRLLEQCLQHGLTQTCANVCERTEDTPAIHQQKRVSFAIPSTHSAAATELVAPPHANVTNVHHSHHNAAINLSGSMQERLKRGYRNRLASVSFDCDTVKLKHAPMHGGSGVCGEHKDRIIRHLKLQRRRAPNASATLSSSTPSAWRLKTAAKLSSKHPVRYRSRSEDRISSGSITLAASCSQQARLNRTTPVNATTTATTSAGPTTASNECDVTIDELASYFETFVHIPKKMSSMAEMMYI